MAIYTAVIDELMLRDECCPSYREEPFKNENVDPLSFVEAQQDSALNLEDSIEVCLDEPDDMKGFEATGWRSKFGSIPRRRRIIFALCLLCLFVLVVSVSVVESKKDRSQLSANTSRFNSPGRGHGGGAGNGVFFESQNSDVFVGDDVRIPPFSVLDPVKDLDRYGFDRPESSTPSARLDPLVEKRQKALPTNAWYQNILRLDAGEKPTRDHRVYTVPYVMDAAGDFAGIRAHATRLETTPSRVGVATDEPYGLTLGAMADVNSAPAVISLDKGYSVHEATDLGVTLQWDSYMKTSLVRGSPYVTMIYDMSDQAVSDGILPTMHWQLDTSELPIVDGYKTIDCESEPIFTVERDLEVVFFNSNQRWIVFFSRPVQLQCKNTQGSPTIFQVSEGEQTNADSFLTIRGALVVSSFDTDDEDEIFSQNYARQLRASADVFPGQSTAVNYSFDEQGDVARISFDWDAQSMRTSNLNGVDRKMSRNANEMIMFALPHHREILAGKVSSTLCTTSIMGPVCLVEGNVWNMYETLPVVGFRAARHPDPKYVPVLAEALVDDILYEIPSNFQSGAADTYFSGKTLAKLARILLVTEELKDLCDSANLGESDGEYVAACDNLELPGDEEIEEALNQLRESVTVWVETNTKAPFVYDNAWGGLVNCGCLYNGDNGGKCTNVFPECPAFTDQGLNFGNGFYNDHHFHYGYHVYAAAALAHFDPAWAVDHYEDVALLVRDYANPSQEDTAFPVFRNKDWYRGHSWAGGITKPMFHNIMNQESVSEAVMAYEAVALFGKTMASVFQDIGDFEMASVAKMMHKIGLTLTATEIRSAQEYWQVRQNVNDSEKIYPKGYTAGVVGILWETSAEFTTWFGNAPYLIYGIQLLPLTAISEARDGLEWANEIYGPLSASCNGACVSEGWSVQVNAMSATIGRVQEAIEGILSIPSTAYEHAGGNGHSKSNALWYISTRPTSNTPLSQSEEETTLMDKDSDENPSGDEDESEPISSNEENFEITSGDEELETISRDEEDPETESTDEEEFETIDTDEEDSESSSGDTQPETAAEDNLLGDFFENVIVDDEAIDENLKSEEESGSNDNNIFDEIMFGNEGSFNSNQADDGVFDDDDGDDLLDIDDDGIDNGGDNETVAAGLTCFNPMGCTDEALNVDAEGYSCGDRIQYLMDVLGKPELDACRQVAVDEYPIQCGSCGPDP